MAIITNICIVAIFYIFCAGNNLRMSINYNPHIELNFMSWEWIQFKLVNSCVSVGIIIFDKILDKATIFFVEFVKIREHCTEIKYITIISFYLQFTISGIVPLVAAAVTLSFSGNAGLVASMSSVFLMNLVLSNLL